jgi:hypothetical protein
MSKERRRHKLFITRNREYHTRDDEVVAVRDRKSGRFLSDHTALQGVVVGGMRGSLGHHYKDGFSAVEPGDSLCISNFGNGIVTSTVEEITRPPKEVVEHYARSTRNAN